LTRWWQIPRSVCPSLRAVFLHRRRQKERAQAAAVEGSRQARILDPQEFAK
jgi:hypothetical protein